MGRGALIMAIGIEIEVIEDLEMEIEMSRVRSSERQLKSSAVMTGGWADTGFPLGCGPCNVPPEVVQRQWIQLQLHAFDGLWVAPKNTMCADPPPTSSKTSDRSISKLSRNFDSKIRAESNLVTDRLKHVEDVAEALSRVLHSTFCGCNLYRGGCPKAVKSFSSITGTT